MTTELSALETVLVKILKAHPGGIRKDDLIAASGWTSYHVSGALRTLRAAGRAEPTLGGSMLSTWATPENAVLIRAEFARAAEAARLQREQRAEARRLSALARAADVQFKERQLSEEEQAIEDFARPSIQSLVPAGEWERPQIPGPSSVFNLTKEAA